MYVWASRKDAKDIYYMYVWASNPFLKFVRKDGKTRRTYIYYMYAWASNPFLRAFAY